MAKSPARTVDFAEQAQALAKRHRELHTDTVEFLAANSDQAIDWNAAELPDYIPEDAAGNIDGLQFGRANVGNVINTFAQAVSLLEGGTPGTGDHLGNLNQLADPA